MDIKPTLSSLIVNTQAAPSATNTLRVLLSALQTQVGSILDAEVLSSRPIKPQEIALLLNTRTQNSTLSPRTRQHYQTLLNATQPTLLKLDIKGTILPVIHHRPEPKGQILSVSVRPDGQLQLRSPETAPGPRVQTPPPTTANLQKGAAADVAPQTQGQNTVKNAELTIKQETKPAISPAIQSAISDVMKRALPTAKPLAETLTQLSKSLPAETSQALRAVLSQRPEIVQNLSRVISQLPALAADRPITSVQLHQGIQNQGIPLEHKLLTLLNKARLSTASPITTPNTLKEQDLRAQLSQLINVFQQPPGAAPAPSSAQVTAQASTSVDTLLMQLLGGAQSNNKPFLTPQHATPSAEANLKAFEQFGAAALARVQLNQYRSVSTLLTAFSEPNAPQTLFTDLTFRLGEAWTSIHLQFQEILQKNSEKNQKKKKQNIAPKWRVFLEMTLDEDADLAVELTQQEKNVSATFWSNSEQVRQKTQAELADLKQSLEKQGLQVSDLRCSDQNPPKQDMKLDYSLIDVRT